jgi:O-acetylhomoserine/O-acetylserine sulfhydrylase-like pyridoxal-dependent enzyme
MNASIDCVAGGAILGFAYDGGGAGQSMTWTNLTERFDQVIESTADFSGASDVFATTITARSITATLAQAANLPVLGLIAIR